MGKDIFVNSEKKYGNDYKNHYLEQYKIYLEGIEKISDRRQSANNFFLTINTILVSILSLSFQENFLKNIFWFKLLVVIIGILFCIIFWFLIRAYKQLNTGKFNVLHKIESKLPLAPYRYEWEILEKWTNKKVYYPFSHIELLIPWIFGIIYVILLFIFICNQWWTITTEIANIK